MPKTAIVTGAAGGIGRAVARSLGEDGWALLLADLDGEAVRNLGEELNGLGHVVMSSFVDITVPASCRKLAETAITAFGEVTALVHAAGIDAPQGRVWEEGEDHWCKVIDVNLTGAWWCASAILPHMLAQGTGRIILIGSVAAKTQSKGTSAAYNAAKAGINGLVIGLSAQLEEHGVLINVVAPGPTGTGTPMTAAERLDYELLYPLGEGGTTPVVEACRYLLGPGGGWISGAVLNVSGGRLRG